MEDRSSGPKIEYHQGVPGIDNKEWEDPERVAFFIAKTHLLGTPELNVYIARNYLKLGALLFHAARKAKEENKIHKQILYARAFKGLEALVSAAQYNNLLESLLTNEDVIENIIREGKEQKFTTKVKKLFGGK